MEIAARQSSEPRRALSCNSLMWGPIVRMFMQLGCCTVVVMQFRVVMQSVRQLVLCREMFRKNYTLLEMFRILERVACTGKSTHPTLFKLSESLSLYILLSYNSYKYSNIVYITLYIYSYCIIYYLLYMYIILHLL